MYMHLAYGCLYNSVKLEGEYSWNDCCLLSGSLHMASHILMMQRTFYSLGVVEIQNSKK